MITAQFDNLTDKELVKLSKIRLNQFERTELMDLIVELGKRLEEDKYGTKYQGRSGAI